jgi:hypothetical protein
MQFYENDHTITYLSPRGCVLTVHVVSASGTRIWTCMARVLVTL